MVSCVDKYQLYHQQILNYARQLQNPYTFRNYQETGDRIEQDSDDENYPPRLVPISPHRIYPGDFRQTVSSDEGSPKAKSHRRDGSASASANSFVLSKRLQDLSQPRQHSLPSDQLDKPRSPTSTPPPDPIRILELSIPKLPSQLCSRSQCSSHSSSRSSSNSGNSKKRRPINIRHLVELSKPRKLASGYVPPRLDFHNVSREAKTFLPTGRLNHLATPKHKSLTYDQECELQNCTSKVVNYIPSQRLAELACPKHRVIKMPKEWNFFKAPQHKDIHMLGLPEEWDFLRPSALEDLIANSAARGLRPVWKD